MNLAEHKGPKGQVLLKSGKDPLWFSSVRDALTYAQSEVVSEKEMAGFWVNDMAQGTWEKPAPGAWIEAKAAFTSSEAIKARHGRHRGSAVPGAHAAEAFAKENGGTVADYASALRSVG